MEYKIKRSRFVEWYFDSGQDSENLAIRESLAEQVIEDLRRNNQSLVTIKSIFDECNHEAVRLNFVEGFTEEDYDREFSDLDGENSLILIE